MEPDANTRNLPDALAGFCVPSFLPCPCTYQAAEKDLIPQDTDSFSQWEPTLVMLMLAHSTLTDLGEQRMVPRFFPLKKNQEEE